MNDWTRSEHPLRSWKPRSPSAKLRDRLFAVAEPGERELPGPVETRWAWLAPVMGCFLAMMVVSSSRSNQFGSLAVAGPTNWLAAVARNQAYAAYVVAGFHSEQNYLHKDPIEWTNGAQVRREPISVNSPATNSLIR